jgi:hypothetical protein
VVRGSQVFSFMADLCAQGHQVRGKETNTHAKFDHFVEDLARIRHTFTRDFLFPFFDHLID